MEQRFEQVVNFSLSNGNVRHLDRVLETWHAMRMQLSVLRERHGNVPELVDLDEMLDWVSEFRIYVNQAESFQS